jgi:hypothetical protein
MRQGMVHWNETALGGQTLRCLLCYVPDHIQMCFVGLAANQVTLRELRDGESWRGLYKQEKSASRAAVFSSLLPRSVPTQKFLQAALDGTALFSSHIPKRAIQQFSVSRSGNPTTFQLGRPEGLAQSMCHGSACRLYLDTSPVSVQIGWATGQVLPVP